MCFWSSVSKCSTYHAESFLYRNFHITCCGQHLLRCVQYQKAHACSFNYVFFYVFTVVANGWTTTFEFSNSFIHCWKQQCKVSQTGTQLVFFFFGIKDFITQYFISTLHSILSILQKTSGLFTLFDYNNQTSKYRWFKPYSISSDGSNLHIVIVNWQAWC